MKPYPQYKDSGVEWIGEVPEHWDVKRLKHVICKIGSGVTPKGGASVYQQSGIPLLRSQNIHFDGLRLDDVAYISEEIHNSMLGSKVLSGDVLLNITGASIGRCCFVDDQLSEANVNQHVCIIRPSKGFITKFIYFFLRSNIGQVQVNLEQTGGGREGLNFEALGSFYILTTEKKEQKIISAFLDRKTAEIDSIIAKKERLIELYEEEKAAVINHAVTKGLDPAAKMKDSGIEWLGEIPEHWEIIPLRRTIWSIDQGWSPIADSSPAIENQHGVLKLSCIREGKFISSENKALLDELSFDIKTLSPTNGDILISRANTPERVGDTCFIDNNYPFLIIPDLIYRLKVNRESLHPKYLVSFLLSRSGRTQIQLDARGTSGSMVKVGQNHLRNWLIPLPLLDEQAAIVQYVETKCSHIDAIISKFKRQIELLKEYRTALISEAVTGKIDVRENMHN